LTPSSTSVFSRYKTQISIVIIASVVLAGFILVDLSFGNINTSTTEASVIEEPAAPVIQYGFDVEDYFIMQDRIKENKFLSDMLVGQGVKYSEVYKLVSSIEKDFDVRQIVAGKSCAYITQNLCEAPSHFVYEPSALYYYVFDLDNATVTKVERDVKREIAMASGSVQGSLWATMDSEGFSWALIERMENALAWTLDFYSIQNGDEYKLIFEKLLVDGEYVGVGELLGAYYKNYSNEYYAINYENEHYTGFYDIEGRPTKRTFLKSPVKYSRVSSGYSGKRFHPVLKRYKSHLGTDYAAPTGTPIYSVANGVVTHAAYTKGNGRYVKIKHDRTYQTQYLHMSRYGEGISPGVHVKQGQVIGYVGQTGLATGPHVCFRFWKNGKQVNHRRLNFPPSDPLPDAELPEYFCERDFIVDIIDSIKIEPRNVQLTKLEGESI
jgi:murein DD-endopeptidase MepM/ murein hydrolase activator NlpD